MHAPPPKRPWAGLRETIRAPPARKGGQGCMAAPPDCQGGRGPAEAAPAAFARSSIDPVATGAGREARRPDPGEAGARPEAPGGPDRDDRPAARRGPRHMHHVLPNAGTPQGDVYGTFNDGETLGDRQKGAHHPTRRLLRCIAGTRRWRRDHRRRDGLDEKRLIQPLPPRSDSRPAGAVWVAGLQEPT